MRRRLSRLRSALRRILPGKEHAFLRQDVRHTAELWAGRPDMTAAKVLDEIRGMNRTRLGLAELEEIGKALELDMHAEAA